MKIDVNGMKNKVKPNLNNAYTYLNRAASSVSAMSIPSDFSYYGTLRSMSQTIRGISGNVKSVYSWVNNVTSKFESAERKNANSINSLLSKLGSFDFFDSVADTASEVADTAVRGIAKGTSALFQTGYDLIESIVREVQNGVRETGSKISTAWKSFQNTVSKTAINLYKGTKTLVSKTVTNVVNEVSKGVSKVEEGITTFAKKGWSKVCNIKQNIDRGLKNTGAFILNTDWDAVYDMLPENMQKDLTVKASEINLGIGFIKGIGAFFEGLVDTAAMVNTGTNLTEMLFSDVGTYLICKKYGVEEKWQSMTLNEIQKTMSFVAEDHVGNAYSYFYKDTIVGQWLDEHAMDFCKSDGILTDISSGIGYIASIVGLTIGTMGIGTFATGGATALSFTTTSAGIATTSGIGKYTQEAWGQARDSSWEGIERLYEKGEITQEEYNTFTTIRSLSDEQWKEIEKDYKNGNISKEEYEQIKQIREMPEDWRNFENGWKGLLYGVANGVWEGVQWYVGGKLAGWTMKGGSKLATSAVRVGADTSFNTLDTPFRTLVSSISSGKTWDEAWKEQGGWKSVITNMGVGLIGSTGGEIFDGLKVNKGSNFTTQIDSNVDFSGETSILEKLKNKFKQSTQQEINNPVDWSKFNTKDIDFTEWNNAKNAYMDFFEKNQEFFNAHGITKEHVQAHFNNVCLCSDADYLNFIKTFYGHSTNCTAFNCNGIVFAPSNLSSKDIAHEVTHSWGNIYRDATGNFNKNYNTVNEAVTETIACSMGLEAKTTVSYSCNVGPIEKITQKLNQKGYTNAFLDAYLSSDSMKIKNLMDGIAGEGYYDELAEKLSKNQNAFVNAYNTGDWGTYYTIREDLERFIERLD